MNVRDMIKEKERGRELVTVDAESDVLEAAGVLADRKISALLVEDKGKLCGIVTERDFVTLLARDGANVKNYKVRDIMVKSQYLVVAEPDDQENHVMAVMIQRGIRHMPVVEQGEIIGIISIRDVVKAHVKKLVSQVHLFAERIK